MNQAEEDALVEKFAGMTYALATRPRPAHPRRNFDLIQAPRLVFLAL